ncbi:hypothetical protein PRIPAC_97771, partial [Pristionchus pacificus]|uniref:Uncharacterized protein n=1 Tax=Pristionchus pacificus TaxID=54126 RepID=A0A2A6D1T3_PRIPA
MLLEQEFPARARVQPINNACIGLQSNPHSAFHTSIARCTRQAKPNFFKSLNPFFVQNVDLTVQASEQENGLDLPFDDIATLRFFFNLGVQQCRAVLLSQLHDQLRKGTTLQLHMHLPSEHLVDDVSSSSTSSSTSSDSPSSTCSLFSSNTSSACT